MFPARCPDISALSSYSIPPDPQFWKIFPAAHLPATPTSPVLGTAISKITEQLSDYMTLSRTVRAQTLVSELTFGSAALFIYDLPRIWVQNSRSEFTDTLAHWIRKGYVVGPFSVPPHPDFIFQIGPLERLWTWAIDDLALEKVNNMSTARKFG